MSELAEHTDAQLVAGVLAGDREAFAAIYDRYADRLHDFCHAVLRDRDDAADAVQDTFVLVAQRLAQLNDPDRLRPWLYAVARSVALRRIRARRRVVLDEAEDMADTDPGPARVAEQVALRELVWSAAAGLSERDRALLDLHVRQGLDGAELGEAMGVSPGHAYVLLTRLRDQVERSLGALLIARQGRRDCTELDALLADWDGRYSPLMRKRVARHVDSCAVCDDRRRIMVSPFALLAAVPLLPAPAWLRDSVMNQVELAGFHGDLSATGENPVVPAADTTVEPGPDTAPDTEMVTAARVAVGAAPRRQRLRVASAAAAAALLLIFAGAVAFLVQGPEPGDPQALEFPVSPTRQVTTDGSSTSTTSSSGTASSATTTTDAVGADGEVLDEEDPGGFDDPGDDSETTTTTTRRVPNPPDPPDPPDPPRDTIPPGITGAGANPDAVRCNESTSVSATITDNVGVTSAAVSWTGGSAGMTRRGDTWIGNAGPFTEDGSFEWTITAVDAAGNPSSAPGKVSVSGCEGTG